MRPFNFWPFFIFTVFLLLNYVNCESVEVDESAEDTGPAVFSSVSAHNHPPAPLPIEKIRSASFSDGSQGKILWKVERSQLPWRGSYSFLGKPENEHPTVLLSVMDDSTGLKIAECATPVSQMHHHSGWRGELDRSFHWHRISWELNEDALQCNTTADLKSIKSTIQSTDSKAFSVRISAGKGPRCIRNLYADEEELTDCPPKMRMHAFQADHLKCGCSTNETDKIEELKSEPEVVEVQKDEASDLDPKIVAALEEPLTNEDPPIFGNVRRKPLPGRSQPPNTAEEITGGSVEITAPAFPMFQFTSSMEKSETETTASSMITETTSKQQELESQSPTIENVETTSQVATSSDDNNEQPTVTSSSPTAISTVTDSESCDCQNNGTCVENPKGKRECSCAEGFGGIRCEKDLCAELGCQNGGKCQVRNGRAVCSCPHGLHGEKCHQIQQPFCNPKCENGGVCALSQSGPMCRCPHGFLGVNCNLRDMCTLNTTCEIYGSQAKCFKEVGDLTRYSPVLQDSAYSCQCPTLNGYVECNSTSSSKSVEVAPTFHSNIQPQQQIGDSNRSNQQGSIETDNSDSQSSISPLSQSTEFGGATDSSTNGAEFPIHSGGPTIQQVIGTRPEIRPSPTPQFPITSLASSSFVSSGSPTSASSLPASTTIRILPRPSSSTQAPELSQTAEFTRLPPSSLQPTTQTSASKASTEEFERLTQVVEASTGSSGTDHVGPKHSMEGEGQTESTDELQPEFHTVGQQQETSTITTTLITIKNNTNDDLTENTTEPRQGNQPSGSWTWIIALAVVGVLLISATIGGVFMGRYVRRSRRLHGKYNPAREENAAVPTTYALPMTSVNKDERLI